MAANKICIEREYVMNVVRRLVTDFAATNEDFPELPVEALQLLMRTIKSKLREDFRRAGKSLQYMTAFLRLEKTAQNKKVGPEVDKICQEIMDLAAKD